MAPSNPRSLRRQAVRDLIFVALIIAFFALAGGLVWLCERIIGRDELAVVDVPTTTEPLEVAA